MSEKHYAIAYARVSTPKQAVEGESLDMQAEHIRAYVRGRGWPLFPDNHVFQEPYTATTDRRPIYDSILQLIRSNPGTIRYFVIKVIDRFSREGSMKYQQMKAELAALGVELRDISGVIQPSVNSLEQLGFSYPWSEQSPSAISEVVLAETAKYERSLILTRLVGAQIKLVQDGYHLGRPDDGYVVRRILADGKKKCAQFPDPDRAPFFRKMYEMRADGAHSDKEIVDHINALGYRSKVWNRWDESRTAVIGQRSGKLLTVKQLQRIIGRPIYCGIICQKWTKNLPIRASGGEPLVSVEVFNRANRGKRFIEERDDGAVSLLYDYQPTKIVVTRHKFSRRWPYKNVAACPLCRKPLFASASRGRSGKHFASYHCHRGHRRYGVQQHVLESAFGAYLDTLRFPPDFWQRFNRVLVATFRKAEREWKETSVDAHKRIALLEERKGQLADAFADASETMRPALDRRVRDIERQLQAIRDEQVAIDISEADLSTFLSYARKLLEHPARILENVANLREQQALYALIFEELPSYEDIAFGTPKLTAVFGLFRTIEDEQTQCMTPLYLDWNLVHNEIVKWKESAWALHAVFDRAQQAGTRAEAA